MQQLQETQRHAELHGPLLGKSLQPLQSFKMRTGRTARLRTAIGQQLTLCIILYGAVVPIRTRWYKESESRGFA